MLSPFLGGPLAPGVVRAGLAFGLGSAAWMLAGSPVPVLDGPAALAAAGAGELAVGTALALLASAPVEAARASGRLADTFRGATLAELHVAPIRQRETAIGDLLAQWVVVLAACAGADRLVVKGLLSTFVAIPAGAPLPVEALREGVIGATGELLAAAAAVSAPAAAGVLAADLCLAFAARLSPRLGVVDAAQPARAALGLLVLASAASAGAGRLVQLAALAGSPRFGGTP
jgi:type III secretory pathway component EscT